LRGLNGAVKGLLVTAMNKVVDQNHRKGGRPLSFDRDAALHKAMLLFWRHGYEGTSLNALTAALGVKPSSIYTAFGDKRRLFLEAVDLYLASAGSIEDLFSDDKPVKEVARDLLVSAAIGFTGENTPPGCLLATSAISCSQESMDVQEMLAKIRRQLEQQLRARISRAIEAGEVCSNVDPAALAGCIMAVSQGMSTLARDGATRSHLMTIIDTTLGAWPSRTA
jgi:AcrR family transcriptional regulator